MSKHIEVLPAYGRTYPNKAAALKDWEAGLDFKTTAGPYVNKSDAENYNLGVVLRNGTRLVTLRKPR